MNFIFAIFVFIGSLFSNQVTVTNATSTPIIVTPTVAAIQIPVHIPQVTSNTQEVTPNPVQVTSSSAELTPVQAPQPVVVPVYIYIPAPIPVQQPTPVQTASQPVITNTPTPMADVTPAPQFTADPVVSITTDNKVNETVTVAWSSDIPATAVFNLVTGAQIQDLQSNPAAGTLQESFAENTNFTYTVLRPYASAEVFSIGITANGQTTWFKRQFSGTPINYTGPTGVL